MLRKLWSLTSVAVALGCGGTEPQTEPSVAENTAALGWSEQCHTLPAHKTINGVGVATSDRNYNHAQCASGYLVDVNQYSAQNSIGSVAAYADAAPTTQAACENLQMRVYAWKRNADSTLTALDGAFPRGRWLTNRWGRQYCQVPIVHLEKEITGYVPGASYRLAMRAHSLDSSGGIVRQRIYFQTVRKLNPPLPGHVVQHAANSLSRINGVTGVHPSLSRVWGVRGTPQLGMLCRDFSLKLAFAKASHSVVLGKLGANPTRITDRLTKEENIYNILCNTANPTAAQQTAFYADIKSSLTLTGQIFNDVATRSALTLDQAAFSVSKLMVSAYDTMVSACSPNSAEVGTFLFNGTKPAGIAGPNVLFRNCNATQVSNMPTLLSLSLGLGGPAVDYRQCVEEALTSLNGICNDPRAQGSSAPGPSTPSAPVRQCERNNMCIDKRDINWDILNQIDDIKSDQARALGALQILDEVEAAAIREAEMNITIADEIMDLGDEIGGVEGEQLMDDGFDMLMDVVETGRLLDAFIEDERRKANEDIDDANLNLNQFCGEIPPNASPTHNLAGCPQSTRCPGFDFADGSRGWYAHEPNSNGFAPTENVYDRVNHCLCQALGNRAPGMCDDPVERQKQDCLTNPLGPDDGPRRECIMLMQPAAMDRDAIEARLCTLIRPDCSDRDVMLTFEGKCGCAPGRGVTGEPVSPRCPAVIRCAEDAILNEKTCLCQPLGAGGTPFVQPLGCAVNTAGFPGGLDQWQISRADAVNLHRISVTSGGTTAVRNTLAFDTGNIAAALPVFRTQDYGAMGEKLFVDVGIPQQAPASGWRGLVQAHITVGNVFNDFVGQVELSTLQPGTRRLEFALPSNARTQLRTADNHVRVTYVFNTDTLSPARTSLINAGFTGATLAPPNPTAACPMDPRITLPPLSLAVEYPQLIARWPFE